MDGRRIRNNKVAFCNLSGIVWTEPKLPLKIINFSQVQNDLGNAKHKRRGAFDRNYRHVRKSRYGSNLKKWDAEKRNLD